MKTAYLLDCPLCGVFMARQSKHLYACDLCNSMFILPLNPPQSAALFIKNKLAQHVAAPQKKGPKQ